MWKESVFFFFFHVESYELLSLKGYGHWRIYSTGWGSGEYWYPVRGWFYEFPISCCGLTSVQWSSAFVRHVGYRVNWLWLLCQARLKCRRIGNLAGIFFFWTIFHEEIACVVILAKSPAVSSVHFFYITKVNIGTCDKCKSARNYLRNFVIFTHGMLL